MNDANDDRDLREAFAALRREEGMQVTGMHRLLERARVERIRRSRTALAPVLAVGTALVVLVLVVGQVLHLSEPITLPGVEQATSLTAWTAPTAFLLRTPGYEFLSTLSAFPSAVPALDSKAPPRSRIATQTPTKTRERCSLP